MIPEAGDGSREPPKVITGVLMTGGNPMKCQVLIDWLTFSIKNIQEPVQVIQKFLGLDPALFQEAPYGLDRKSTRLNSSH